MTLVIDDSYAFFVLPGRVSDLNPAVYCIAEPDSGMLFYFFYLLHLYLCCIKKVKKNIILVVNRFLDIPVLMSITPPGRSVKIRLHRNRRGKNPFSSVFTVVESGSGSGSRRRTSPMDPDPKTHLPMLC